MEEDTRDGKEKRESAASRGDEDDGNESDDSEGRLQIRETPEKIRTDTKMTLRSRRKRKVDDEDLIDHAIEEKLQECAKKNNLSSVEMKMLLRKVVKNDHVLALVKIQEEEELARESFALNRSKDGDEANDTGDNDVRTPKFTRSTARALNKKPLPILVLSDIQSEPEIAALISEELHPDEEDEEYQPREEEYASDDDPNTTVSDIDSQPCTPQTPATHCDHDDDQHEERYTKDGLFKLPRGRNDSTASYHEEIIAKRTRSKVCLQATPIETIESNFIPPDITTDMYNFDGEIDHDWKKFLNDFIQPYNPNPEDDDEADPEYVAADHEPKVDSEELRDVNISKKEISDLVAELFDGLVYDDDVTLENFQFEMPKKSSDKSPQKKRPRLDQTDESFNSSQNNATAFQPNVMSTPNQIENCLAVSVAPDVSDIPEISTQNTEVVVPTTAKPPRAKQYVQTSQGYQPLVDVVDLTAHKSPLKPIILHQQILPPNQFIVSQPATPGSQPVAQLASSFQQLPPPIILTTNSTLQPLELFQSNSSRPIKLIPLTQQLNGPLPPNLITVVPLATSAPTSTTAAAPQNTITVLPLPTLPPISQNLNESTSNAVAVPNPAPNTTKPITQTMIGEGRGPNPTPERLDPGLNVFPYTLGNRSLRTHLKTDYRTKYEQLKTLRAINEPKFDENQKGFTKFQRKILDQQMRIHVQFIAQFFFQVYSHPDFWKYASTEKNMMIELDENNKEKTSAFNACNLKEALQLITDWEKELSVNSAENTALMEFVYNEIEKSKRRTNFLRCVTRFPPRIMKRIVRSPVFIYCDLLPKMPFRPEVPNYFEMLPAMDQLIAHGLQKVYSELEEYEMRVRPNKPMRVSLNKVCRQIARDHIHGKTADCLYAYVRKRAQDVEYNPIKFYFEHKKAPPYTHVIYDIDPNNILPPEDRLPELPALWQEFVNRLRALEYEKTTNPQRYSNSINAVRDYNEPKIDVFNVNRANNSVSNITIHVNYVSDQAAQTTSTESAREKNNSPAIIPQKLESCEEEFKCEHGSCETTKQERPSSQTDYSYVFTKLHASLPPSDPRKTLQFYKFGNNFTSSSESRCSSLSPVPPFPQDSVSNILPAPRQPREEKPSKSAGPADTSQSKEKVQLPKGQTLLTDYFKVEDLQKKREEELAKLRASRLRILARRTRKFNSIKKRILHRGRLQFQRRQKGRKQALKKRIQRLLTAYRRSFNAACNRFRNAIVRRVFRSVRALEVYSDLLIDLKMNAKKMKPTEDGSMKKASGQTKTIAGGAGGDEENPKPRKPYRVGESLRQMLLPESKEDTNEKDAVFAMNFFDKVEEIFLSTENGESFRTFQKILKSFDPRKDRVADLYYKMEKLFLPDYPDLAEIFLTFLLPAEAIEIGKFFEHFMISNMGNFINKLNIFFNKQPGQVKKVYGALNELADEKNVTIEQIKLKIMPLLKGNKFLADWFLQTFETEKPNQSISNIHETVSFKQMESHQNDSVAYETLLQKDILEESSATTENHPCQFKYINGGIFYGSRILLPAKLSFLATELMKTAETDDDRCETPENDTRLIGIANPCVHGIRDYAEKRLKNHLDKSDEGGKSEDESDKQTYTLCDDTTFKAHAARLNPALYQSPPNHHHTSTLKTKCSDAERDLKSSPKKQCNQKRRSPKKNLPKSPVSAAVKKSSATPALNGPPDSSKAISMAKKLKSLTGNSGGVDADNAAPKPKRKQQQKSQKTTSSSEQLSEMSGNQSSSDVGTSDSDKSVCEPKRKQIKSSASMLTPLCSMDETVLPNSAGSIATQLESISSSSSPIEIKPTVWTRDEDKIILEEVKSGFNNESSLVSRLISKLPYRSEIEIKKRHNFLMEVLTQLQGKVS